MDVDDQAVVITRPSPEPWRKTKSEATMDARHKNKSRVTRMKEAAQKVVYDGFTQSEAARIYGVSRPRLNAHVQALKNKYKEQQDRAEAATKAEQFDRVGREWNGLNERRRVPSPIEFDNLYFNNVICPDCHVHHERPPFHEEMWAAARSSSHRTGINVPPYHAKSTTITVKDTLYDIIENPNSRTAIISRSAPSAEEFMVSISEYLTNTMLYEGAYRNLIDDWGPFREPNSIWNKHKLYVAGRITPEKDPTVQALGVGSQVYGKRLEKVKFDDIADTENQRNPERVQNMLQWIDKMALSRVGKSGKAIWVGTRVYAGDVYAILKERKSYEWMTYSCILDFEEELTLWPEHFPFSQAMIHMDEMSEADFQLVYQNVELPGAGAAFPPELVEAAKDKQLVAGRCPSGVRVVAGLDPAGVGKRSGFTAMVVLAVDIVSGHRVVLEVVNVKSMKAPDIKAKMVELCDRYPISEWRVESGAVQSQLWQDPPLMQALANRGVRVKEHYTGTKKWDPQFGVESMSALFHSGLISIPWAGQETQKMMAPLVRQLVAFPMNMGLATDVLMALWFAEIAAREYSRRSHLPLFSDRQRVPLWVARRRKVVDLGARSERNVPLSEQRTGVLQPDRFGNRRSTLGSPMSPAEVMQLSKEYVPEPARVAVNVDLAAIWSPSLAEDVLELGDSVDGSVQEPPEAEVLSEGETTG